LVVIIYSVTSSGEWC